MCPQMVLEHGLQREHAIIWSKKMEIWHFTAPKKQLSSKAQLWCDYLQLCTFQLSILLTLYITQKMQQ